MMHQKIAWYRHRAEEEGRRVVLRLERYMQLRRRRGRLPAEQYVSPDITCGYAREAAHYANLVLGPEDGLLFEELP